MASGLAEIAYETKAMARWAVRPASSSRYLRQIQLPRCASEDPANCLLRGSSELPSGETPTEAVASLLDCVERDEDVTRVTMFPFEFSGPIAHIDDRDLEAELLSPEFSSPLWHDLREAAARRQVGLIHLKQLGKLIVPVLALRESDSSIEPLNESTFQTRFALEKPEEEWP